MKKQRKQNKVKKGNCASRSTASNGYIPVCFYSDCIYANTIGCRVHGLGVFGLIKCEKYKGKPDKTFSDTLAMIDKLREGEESTYETAVRICNHYRQTKA